MPTICHVIVIPVLFCQKQESFGFFSLARFLKLKIAVRQQSIEICNARRYWSMLLLYCVDIIRLNHLRLKVVFFYCGVCHCFYRYTDAFFIIYWSVIFYECIHLTVSESDMIKLFNQSIYKEHHVNSTLGSKRRQSNFVYRQHWFIIWNWFQTLFISWHH